MLIQGEMYVWYGDTLKTYQLQLPICPGDTDEIPLKWCTLSSWGLAIANQVYYISLDPTNHSKVQVGIVYSTNEPRGHINGICRQGGTFSSQ